MKAKLALSVIILTVSCSLLTPFQRIKQTGFKAYKIENGYIDNEIDPKISCNNNEKTENIYCFGEKDLAKIKYALDGCGGF